MFTLCIHYTIDPNKLADFRKYAEVEQAPIRRSGGQIVGYFLPTDYAGPTNEAYGLIGSAGLRAAAVPLASRQGEPHQLTG